MREYKRLRGKAKAKTKHPNRKSDIVTISLSLPALSHEYILSKRANKIVVFGWNKNSSKWKRNSDKSPSVSFDTLWNCLHTRTSNAKQQISKLPCAHKEN